ncbi:MAG: hypothetical protein ACRDRK_19860 [Pseudonocardia sp.]
MLRVLSASQRCGRAARASPRAAGGRVLVVIEHGELHERGVVPEVGAAEAHLLPHAVADHRRQLVDPGVERIPQRHELNRVDPGIMITPVVVHVRVRRGEVRDGVVAQQEPLEHRLVDDPAHVLLVGPDALQVGRIDSGPDHLLVHRIEIDHPDGRVLLGSERHQHEAERAKVRVCRAGGRRHLGQQPPHRKRSMLCG